MIMYKVKFILDFVDACKNSNTFCANNFGGCPQISKYPKKFIISVLSISFIFLIIFSKLLLLLDESSDSEIHTVYERIKEQKDIKCLEWNFTSNNEE